MTKIRLICCFVSFSLLPGCTGASRPLVRGFDDGARIACEAFFSASPEAEAEAEKAGKSLAEYAKEACQTADILRKFYRPFLEAQKLGKAGATPDDYAEGKLSCEPSSSTAE